MLLPFLTVFDFNTVRANFIKPLDLNKVVAKSYDFALLVPIFNDIKYLGNIDFLKQYKNHVVLCTTSQETEKFTNDLTRIAKENSFRISTTEIGTNYKNPWVIYCKTLLAHDAVLKSTIERLKEKYVIFLDGDTWVDGDLSTLCGAMEEKGFDIASVKILPSRRETVIEKLQGVEYDIAMQARLLYPWLTSGAGMVAKKDVMIEIMKNHSLFFNGGDVEIGKLADKMGYKVGHIPMLFYSEVPSTFIKWVKQRFSWMCGMFRHSIVNMDINIKHPFHFIYFSFIIYFLLPFKLLQMAQHVSLIPIILTLYALTTYIANWKVRSRWMLIFPFYALFQVVVITWFGIYRYLKTVIKTRNIGKIRMKNNPNNITLKNPAYAFSTVRNLGTIFTVIFLISFLSVGSFQKIFLGREIPTEDLAIMAYSRTVNQVNVRLASNNKRDLDLLPDESPREPEIAPEVAGLSTESEIMSVLVEKGDDLYKIANKALLKHLEENGKSLPADQFAYASDTLRQRLEPLKPYDESYYYAVNKEMILQSLEVTKSKFTEDTLNI